MLIYSPYATAVNTHAHVYATLCTLGHQLTKQALCTYMPEPCHATLPASGVGNNTHPHDVPISTHVIHSLALLAESKEDMHAQPMTCMHSMAHEAAGVMRRCLDYCCCFQSSTSQLSPHAAGTNSTAQHATHEQSPHASPTNKETVYPTPNSTHRCTGVYTPVSTAQTAQVYCLVQSNQDVTFARSNLSAEGITGVRTRQPPRDTGVRSKQHPGAQVSGHTNTQGQR